SISASAASIATRSRITPSARACAWPKWSAGSRRSCHTAPAKPRRLELALHPRRPALGPIVQRHERLDQGEAFVREAIAARCIEQHDPGIAEFGETRVEHGGTDVAAGVLQLAERERVRAQFPENA